MCLYSECGCECIYKEGCHAGHARISHFLHTDRNTKTQTPQTHTKKYERVHIHRRRPTPNGIDALSASPSSSSLSPLLSPLLTSPPDVRIDVYESHNCTTAFGTHTCGYTYILIHHHTHTHTHTHANTHTLTHTDTQTLIHTHARARNIPCKYASNSTFKRAYEEQQRSFIFNESSFVQMVRKKHFFSRRK
jgi:hypothetical protein